LTRPGVAAPAPIVLARSGISAGGGSARRTSSR
jgi:hypothetical protein